MRSQKWYEQLLENSYAIEQSHLNYKITRYGYLSENIFLFTTGDSGADESLGSRAVDVCEAITDGTTFQYIDHYNLEYLTMVNMPFFDNRLLWGVSIRGAWWDNSPHKHYEFHSCGMYDEEKQVTEMKSTYDEWINFIKAVIAFGRKTDPEGPAS